MEVLVMIIAIVLIGATFYLAREKNYWGLVIPIFFALLGGMYSIIDNELMETMGALCNSFSLINAIIFFGIATKK